jgi:hypothetical protein
MEYWSPFTGRLKSVTGLADTRHFQCHRAIRDTPSQPGIHAAGDPVQIS